LHAKNVFSAREEPKKEDGREGKKVRRQRLFACAENCRWLAVRKKKTKEKEEINQTKAATGTREKKGGGKERKEEKAENGRPPDEEVWGGVKLRDADPAATLSPAQG
jgi:hypothetical protein